MWNLEGLFAITTNQREQRWLGSIARLADGKWLVNLSDRQLVNLSDRASFNHGYRGFAQSYRTCTPAADLVIRRYLEEGQKIARDITGRYAN